MQRISFRLRDYTAQVVLGNAWKLTSGGKVTRSKASFLDLARMGSHQLPFAAPLHPDISQTEYSPHILAVDGELCRIQHSDDSSISVHADSNFCRRVAGPLSRRKLKYRANTSL